MKTPTTAGLVTAAMIIGACGSDERPAGRAPAVPAPPRDQSSFANASAFVTTHLALDLAADFGARTLSGTAALTLARLDHDATELVLDTRDLDIRRAEAAIDGGSEKGSGTHGYGW